MRLLDQKNRTGLLTTQQEHQPICIGSSCCHIPQSDLTGSGQYCPRSGFVSHPRTTEHGWSIAFAVICFLGAEEWIDVTSFLHVSCRNGSEDSLGEEQRVLAHSAGNMYPICLTGPVGGQWHCKEAINRLASYLEFLSHSCVSPKSCKASNILQRGLWPEVHKIMFSLFLASSHQFPSFFMEKAHLRPNTEY